jgi:transposase
MTEGGSEVVRAEDKMVPAAELRQLEERRRDRQQLLGRETMENEILKEALDRTRAKKSILLPNSGPLDGSR